MINLQRIIQKAVSSVNWIELILIILNSGIGLAGAKYLGYDINWVISTYFILWLIFLFLGSKFIWLNQLIDNQGEDLISSRQIRSIILLLALLFLSLSVIPFIQILIVSLKDLLQIYLLSLLCSWFLLRIYLEQKIKIFGLSESISAFMICFVTPLIIINFYGIQNHEILLDISFFSFLQLIAYQLFRNIFELDKGIIKAEFISAYIGPYSILKIISCLIILGYISCFTQLFVQDRMKLFYPLGVTLPIALFFIYRINHLSRNIKKEVTGLVPLSIILILFVEVSWVIGLWRG